MPLTFSKASSSVGVFLVVGETKILMGSHYDSIYQMAIQLIDRDNQYVIITHSLSLVNNYQLGWIYDNDGSTEIVPWHSSVVLFFDLVFPVYAALPIKIVAFV